MKIITIICCLLLFTMAFGQNGTPLTIVNREVYTGDIKTINPQDIISTDILQGSAAKDFFDGKGANGVIVIVTKSFAISEYQKKISAYSPKYKDYIARKHDDSNLQYVINNTIMNVKRKSAIRVLYQLAPNNISKVEFKKVARFITDATVIISTKDSVESDE